MGNGIRREYFNRFIDAMKWEGYQLFSRVTIDYQIFMIAKWARDTSLFFRLPGRQLIVQAVFRERDTAHGEVIKYWSFRLYCGFRWDVEYISRESLHDEDRFDIPGFVETSGWYNQEGMEEVADAEALAAVLGGQLELAKPYLSSGRFPILNVSDFCLYGRNDRLSASFWGRFNRIALQEIVRYPFGEGFA